MFIDGLVLTVFALNKINEKWNISELTNKVSQIHAATGRDTTSFLHVVGKIKVSQWKSKAEASKHNAKFQTVQKFVQTICYSGKEQESLTETRVL